MHDMGQHIRHIDHNFTDLVYMALRIPHDICYVLVDKQLVSYAD